jgi:hypothetical protein
MSYAATPDRVQTTINKLLATAERCRRLAPFVTDRETCGRLLELARESEEEAGALQQAVDKV